MESALKMKITIQTSTKEEQLAIGNSIHHQLVGNQDYIDCNIILNIDVENEVNLYIFEECKDVPHIVL